VRGYASEEIFDASELELYALACGFVEAVPYEIDGEAVRCHELVRAVVAALPPRFSGVRICDGYYGMVEHSWIWTRPPALDKTAARGWIEPPNILDVYAPGRVPLVELVAVSVALPCEYRRGDSRKDLKRSVIARLTQLMLGKQQPCVCPEPWIRHEKDCVA